MKKIILFVCFSLVCVSALCAIDMATAKKACKAFAADKDAQSLELSLSDKKENVVIVSYLFKTQVKYITFVSGTYDGKTIEAFNMSLSTDSKYALENGNPIPLENITHIKYENGILSIDIDTTGLKD